MRSYKSCRLCLRSFSLQLSFLLICLGQIIDFVGSFPLASLYTRGNFSLNKKIKFFFWDAAAIGVFKASIKDYQKRVADR